MVFAVLLLVGQRCMSCVASVMVLLAFDWRSFLTLLWISFGVFEKLWRHVNGYRLNLVSYAGDIVRDKSLIERKVGFP